MSIVALTLSSCCVFFFQAEAGIRDDLVTGVQTCALPMTRTVACLEEAGLVTRRPSETDGRQVVVELTPEAHRVLDEDRARRTAWLATRIESLSPDEVEQLARVAPLLERIATS